MQDISSKHSHADVRVSWLGSTQWGSFLLCSPLFKCKKEFKRNGQLLLCSVVQYFFHRVEHVVQRPRGENVFDDLPVLIPVCKRHMAHI